MKRTVAGGTSPTAVILWPSTTVENAGEGPTVADSGADGGPEGAPCRSTNTDTEAKPSVNTRWSTAAEEPGMICAARRVMRKPGGRFMALQAGAAASDKCGAASVRSH